MTNKLTDSEVIEILSNIEDMPIEKAEEYLTKYSTLFGCKISHLIHLIDAFNNISNNYPITIEKLLKINLVNIYK